jgi:RNA polymerase sigma-70 factor (ECF subfamily)
MARREDLRETLEALTPPLRRYARAITAGEANSLADDLVLEALNAVRDEPPGIAKSSEAPADLRLRLYAAFARVAQKKLRCTTSTGPTLRHPVIVHGLADLRFEDRETLLLVVLEGFSYDDVATIVGVDREVVLMRLMRARARLTAFDKQPSTPSDGSRRASLHLRVVK